MAAAAPSVYRSANHERVLTRHLLSLKDDNKNQDNDLSESQAQEDFLDHHWPKELSFYTVLGVLMISTVLLIMSVAFWARRQQEPVQPR